MTLGGIGTTANIVGETQPHVTAQNALGKAFGYLTNFWIKLMRCTEAGYLPIDKNEVSVRAIPS